MNKHCIYAKIFTTPVSSEETFKGNKKPHPFTISVDLPLNREVEGAVLTIRMIGESYTLFPYLFLAVQNAGRNGIFKARMKFFIEKLTANGEEVLIKGDKLDLNITPKQWQLNESESPLTAKQIVIRFITPLKIVRKQFLVRNLNYEEFIKNGLRRLKLLTYFYGENSDLYVNLRGISDMPKEEENLINIASYRYYSFRQKNAVNMKGFIGQIEVKKEFLPVELSLLKGIETFGIGKATSFGFGHTKIVEGKYD